METLKILSSILIIFCLGGLFLSIANPSWVYHCNKGEKVNCSDAENNKIENQQCVCENGWEEGGNKIETNFLLAVSITGLIGAIIAFTTSFREEEKIE